MTDYATLSDWEAAQGGAGPVLLWDHDFTADGSADWIAATPSDIGGLAVTVTNSGPPATWGPDGATGLAVTGAGAVTGTIRIDWADIETLMSRALVDTDQIVVEFQSGAALEGATVTNTKSVVEVNVTAGNNIAWAGIQKSAGANRRVSLWTGSATDAVLDTLASARSVVLRVSEYAAWGNVVTGTLSAAPVSSGTYLIQGSGSRALSAPGPWDPTSAGSWFHIMLGRAAGETVATVIERARIWLIPGEAYTP